MKRSTVLKISFEHWDSTVPETHGPLGYGSKDSLSHLSQFQLCFPLQATQRTLMEAINKHMAVLSVSATVGSEAHPRQTLAFPSVCVCVCTRAHTPKEEPYSKPKGRE